MMSRADRAKQFAPFDAMKGLSEALRKREEMHCRTEKRELSEEITDRNSTVLASLTPGDSVSVRYYDAHTEKEKIGTVRETDAVRRILKLDTASVPFENIYFIVKN